MGVNVVDYYKVLGLDQSSSINEIKRSFRKRAKELHPDLNPDGSPQQTSDSEAMTLLVKAYKVLSDPILRRKYDQARFCFEPRKSVYKFEYREFLKSNKEDLQCQSKLVFYDLINSNSDEALDLYEDLISRGNFKMDRYLDRADYLECVFLLAEEFEKRGKYDRAFKYLKKLYCNELQTPFFKHYTEEIVDRMKNVVCFKMANISPANLIIKRLNELVKLDFPNKDKAFFYKKMAEVAIKEGKKEEAIEYLNHGLKYNKKLSGIKKLKERIGI